MRASARSLGACWMSRYGTRDTGKPWVLMKADKIRSELPAAAATLSVSGFARASATNSPSVFTFRDVGAESAITMVVTFVTEAGRAPHRTVVFRAHMGVP